MTAARASHPCSALFCHDCVLGHIKGGSEAVWGLLFMGYTCVAGRFSPKFKRSTGTQQQTVSIFLSLIQLMFLWIL